MPYDVESEGWAKAGAGWTFTAKAFEKSGRLLSVATGNLPCDVGTRSPQTFGDDNMRAVESSVRATCRALADVAIAA